MSLLYAFLFLILEAVPDFHKSSAQKRLLLEHFIVSRLGGGLLPPGTGESIPTHGDLLQCNLSVTAGQSVTRTCLPLTLSPGRACVAS